jgi:pyridoxal biosynthesis lyase PdxS
MPNSEDGTGDVAETKTKADVIRKALEIFEKKFTDEKLKITASEYIRLLELLQQVEEVKPREIRIRWVQPSETTESNTEE